ncbi:MULTISPECIES: PcfB family protein [Clostridia]|uniref:PcfB family protein n=1 Tax=Clostridia TaxID=186801 RepID=UPI00067E9993|nr:MULTISPECIES: PcfB family protein [Clostridia]
MNYGGDAADQLVRYSMDGLDHGIRLSGTLAKNLAVFLAAVLKSQGKTHGRTRMIQMLKDGRPLKFFTVPADRLREFCQEGKRHGLLYVVIRDRKNPEICELMVYADDAAKVNRVMEKMNLDFVKSEVGEAVHEIVPETGQDKAGRTKTVEMPEGEIQFEIHDEDQDFNFDVVQAEAENFTQAQDPGAKNPSGHSLRSSGISSGQEKENEKPSVRRELNQIKEEQKESASKKKQRGRNRNTSRRKKKAKTKGR